MKLYELTENFNNLIEVLENVEEENKDLVISALNEVEGDFNNKVENIIKYIKNIESDIEAFKNEEKRLKRQRHTLENRVEYLKGYLMQNIERLNTKEVKGGIFTASIRKTPLSVEIEDIDLLPQEFCLTVKVPDKRSIKEALKENREINGAKLTQHNTLKIK